MIVDRLQKVLLEVAGPGRVTAALDPGTPLRDGGLWLDSVALLELIVAVESEFGVDFEPADLTEASLRTVESLAAVVARRLGAR